MTVTSPMVQKACGVKDPKAASHIIATGIRKYHEWEFTRKECSRKQIRSYGDLVWQFATDTECLQQCCITGKLKQRPVDKVQWKREQRECRKAQVWKAVQKKKATATQRVEVMGQKTKQTIGPSQDHASPLKAR